MRRGDVPIGREKKVDIDAPKHFQRVSKLAQSNNVLSCGRSLTQTKVTGK